MPEFFQMTLDWRKWLASQALPHLVNAAAVWSAVEANGPLPPFVLKNGQVIHHAPQDEPEYLFCEVFVFASYFDRGFYSPRQGDTVLDCGANVGFFALWLSALSPQVRIHCFEPSSDARSRLTLNIASNELTDRLLVYPFGLLDCCCYAGLKQTWASGHRSFFEYDRVLPDASETCECISLERAVELCNAQHLDLLKIDVEGAELEILEGASEATLHKVRRIVVEYHDYIRPDCGRRVLARLKSTRIS